jgi:hypothetical protein
MAGNESNEGDEDAEGAWERALAEWEAAERALEAAAEREGQRQPAKRRRLEEEPPQVLRSGGHGSSRPASFGPQCPVQLPSELPIATVEQEQEQQQEQQEQEEEEEEEEEEDPAELARAIAMSVAAASHGPHRPEAEARQAGVGAGTGGGGNGGGGGGGAALAPPLTGLRGRVHSKLWEALAVDLAPETAGDHASVAARCAARVEAALFEAFGSAGQPYRMRARAVPADPRPASAPPRPPPDLSMSVQARGRAFHRQYCRAPLGLPSAQLPACVPACLGPGPAPAPLMRALLSSHLAPQRVSHSCACIGSPCLRHRVHGASIPCAQGRCSSTSATASTASSAGSCARGDWGRPTSCARAPTSWPTQGCGPPTSASTW